MNINIQQMVSPHYTGEIWYRRLREVCNTPNGRMNRYIYESRMASEVRKPDGTFKKWINDTWGTRYVLDPTQF